MESFSRGIEFGGSMSKKSDPGKYSGKDLDNLVFAELRFSHLRFSVVDSCYPQEPLKITGPIIGDGYSGIRFSPPRAAQN
ncbi:MAG: hypothetical protein WEB57_00945 [Pseudohongiellaceae bacterium]